jgi:hypothetical protein
MPTVRYTGGGTYRVDGVGFDPGDEKDVNRELADYLTDRDDFEMVDDAGDDDVSEEDGPPDVDEWEDWGESDWLELGYTQRADDVREGRVDDYLDEIDAVETSDTVIEAVEDRRSELED